MSVTVIELACCILPVLDWQMFLDVERGIRCRSLVCDTDLVDEELVNRQTGQRSNPF